MLKTNFNRFFKLDDIVNKKANGIYVVPSNEGQRIRIRDLVKYCKDEAKDSSKLSQKEIEGFYR